MTQNDDLQKQLEEKERAIWILKNIINLSPVNLFWKDAEGQFLGCNHRQANILFNGHAPEKIQGFKNKDFFPHLLASLTQANQTDRFVIDTEKEISYEEKGYNQAHHQAIYLTKKAPLYDNQNKLCGIVGTSLDITDLKNAEAALKLEKERAELLSQSKTEFLANMSHDIKTPIAGITSIAESFMRRLEGNDKMLAEKLFLAASQLSDFISHCVDIAKMDVSNVAFIKEIFSLRSVIQDVCHLCLPSLKTKDLAISTEIGELVPEYINGSRMGAYRILLNLVSNAVKFTQKGTITVRCALDSTIDENTVLLKITVSDTGIGISKENQKIIFDRYTRLHSTYTGTYEGSGMGLYIAKSFAQAMEGEITVESDEKKGSQFIVTLPFTRLSEEAASAQTAIEQKSLPLHEVEGPLLLNTKVLLIEDNEIAQNINHHLLTSLHCIVDIAPTGEKALQLFQPGKYDLILVDIGLPGMQGDEVAKKVRMKEKNTSHHVPLIALTAHVADEMKSYYLTSGIDAVHNKPLLYDQAKTLIFHYCSK